MKKTVDQGLKDTGTMQWKKVGKTTACLRIKGMSYDDASYNSSDMEDYAEMREELRSAEQQHDQRKNDDSAGKAI